MMSGPFYSFKMINLISFKFVFYLRHVHRMMDNL